MGGGEAIKKVLELDPEAKAIVSSGYSNDPIMANFKEYGFKAMVSKPFHFEEMQKILESTLQSQSNKLVPERCVRLLTMK
jgi:DNA-binding NarL/FixJ family response regulator